MKVTKTQGREIGVLIALIVNAWTRRRAVKATEEGS